MNIIDELFFSTKRQVVDDELRKIFSQYIENNKLRENILYHTCLDRNIKPTIDSNKRLRAYLCLLFGEGNNINPKQIIPLAVVVEMIHNATLIVDDIQDNGEIRCGRPALWKKVGIPEAMNAAFYLAQVALAYYNIELEKRKYYNYSDKIIILLDKLISGQQLDIIDHKKMSIDLFEKIAKGKTGALLTMSCMFGAMPFSFNENTLKLISAFVDLFSCAYQAKDDLADLKLFEGKTGFRLDPTNVYFCFHDESNRRNRVESELLIKNYITNKKYEINCILKRMEIEIPIRIGKINDIIELL